MLTNDNERWGFSELGYKHYTIENDYQTGGDTDIQATVKMKHSMVITLDTQNSDKNDIQNGDDSDNQNDLHPNGDAYVIQNDNDTNIQNDDETDICCGDESFWW